MDERMMPPAGEVIGEPVVTHRQPSNRAKDAVGCGLGCLAIVVLLFIFAAVSGIRVFNFFASLDDGMRNAQEQFFADLHAGRIEDAYAETAQAFKDRYPPEIFREIVANRRLDHVGDTTFTHVSINDGEGSLGGKLTLDDGSSIPVMMDFVKVGKDKWLITDLRLDEVPPSSEDDGKPSPSGEGI